MARKKTKKENENVVASEMQSKFHFPTPKEMCAELDKFIIGQEKAKKVLSVAIYNHYKRVLSTQNNISPSDEFSDVTIDKSNILLCGNTGTGKTFILKNIAKMVGLPCYIADSTKLTESGYVGDDVESILVGLLQEADYDTRLAEVGIVVLDEIDKIGRKGDNASITRDVSGEGVQQGLLKIVEGGRIGVPPKGGRKHPEQSLIYLDTTNILFIGMGAFDGLSRIIERRTNRSSIGFDRPNATAKEVCENPLSKITASDLKSFGLIPELIGRFPIVTYTEPLTKDDLVRILTEPKNAIVKQYKKLMALDGVALSFTEGALDKIAESALELGIGARGVRGIMEKVLTDVMYEKSGCYGTEAIIDLDTVSYILDKDVKIKAA